MRLSAAALAVALAFPGAARAAAVASVPAEVGVAPEAPLASAASAAAPGFELAALPQSAPALPTPRAQDAAGPAQVILIRHGEKPASGNDLSPQGYQRAQALVGFFENNPAVTRYGTPVAIYAEKPKANGSEMRPFETVKPLADSLGLTVDTDFKKADAQGLAQDILSNPDYAGKMVLISWEHHMLPAIVQALGWTQGPDAYPDAAFDRVWTLNFEGGVPVSFTDTPQHLLPGDSSK